MKIENLIAFCLLVGCKTSNPPVNSQFLAGHLGNGDFFADLSSEAFAAQTRRPPKFIIETALTELMGDPDILAHRPAHLIDPSGKKIAVDLAVRGASSRTTCKLKKLGFTVASGEVTNGTVLAGLDDIAIGTHCEFPEGANDFVRLGDSRAVAREVLAYRLVELTLPISRRARLVEIEYVDTSNGARESHPAFFLEDTKAMRKRTGMKKPQTESVNTYKEMDLETVARVMLAEGLIDNTDWQLAEIVYNGAPTLRILSHVLINFNHVG